MSSPLDSIYILFQSLRSSKKNFLGSISSFAEEKYVTITLSFAFETLQLSKIMATEMDIRYKGTFLNYVDKRR